jgi:hypothetical protein
MSDPTDVGARVLHGLNKGRELAIKRARDDARERDLMGLVQRAALLDRSANRPDRGRAGRIARRLQATGCAISERHVRRLLDGLNSVSGSPLHDACIDSTTDTAA